MRLQTLPYVDVQPDALAVFEDVAQSVVSEEDIWVSGYRLGETSVHGKARLSRGAGSGSGSGSAAVELRAREGVQVERISHTAFKVSVPALGVRDAAVRFPKQVLRPEYTKTTVSSPLSINSLDVSPDGSQLVYGGPDGYARVQGTKEGSGKPVQLKGHVGDVLTTRWFPSGKVILTGSSDTTLRIFSSLDGSSPRTLTGHRRAVTSTQIVGAGRTVLSGSKDGSVRLWDVGQGKGVATVYAEGYAGVERIVRPAEEGKEAAGLVYATTSAGGLTAFDVDSKTTVFTARHLPDGAVDGADGLGGGAVPALAVNGHTLATGNTRGVIVVRDTRMLSTSTTDGLTDQGILAAFRRTEAGINDLAFVSPHELAIASASGLPCRVDLSDLAAPRVAEEYAGWEPVPVETVAVGSEGSVWFAGGEGGMRRY